MERALVKLMCGDERVVRVEFLFFLVIGRGGLVSVLSVDGGSRFGLGRRRLGISWRIYWV